MSKWPTRKPEKADPGACVKSRCEPCHLRQVLEVVAAVRGEDPEDVARQAWENTRNLFGDLGEAT